MNTSNTITTKRRKTQMKVASFIQLNEHLIAKYGSFNALKSQRTLFTQSRQEEYRRAFNDYKNYMSRKKFIENNFQSALATLSESDTNNRNDATNITIVVEEENSRASNSLPRCEKVREDEKNGADDNEDDYDINNNNERNEQSDNNNVLLDEDRKLRDENTENMFCSNCRRRQCNDLIEQYGETYRLVFYRYVMSI